MSEYLEITEGKEAIVERMLREVSKFVAILLKIIFQCNFTASFFSCIVKKHWTHTGVISNQWPVISF